MLHGFGRQLLRAIFIPPIIDSLLLILYVDVVFLFLFALNPIYVIRNRNMYGLLNLCVATDITERSV